jgi:hypothetical protein
MWGGLTTIVVADSEVEQLYNTMWKYVPDPACVGSASGTLGYQLSTGTICPGDSAFISFSGDSAITISPGSYVTWIDSAHAILKPDTTTVFTIDGYTPCGSYAIIAVTLPVLGTMVSITSNNLIMCSGDTTQICGPTGFTGYNWSTGDTTTCIITTSAGNYYLTVTANGNCSATSNEVNIRVYPPSPVTISVSGDTLTGYTANSYQWFLNGVAIPGATSSVYIAQASGTYTLQITDTNGCIATSSPVLITGIVNELPENSITIFPNPTGTAWQLAVTAELIGSMAEVFDATGQLVFKSAIRNPQSAVNIPNATSGVYELRITGQGYSAVKKLVKM